MNFRYVIAALTIIAGLSLGSAFFVGLQDSREWKVPARDAIDAFRPVRVGSNAVNLLHPEGAMEAPTDSSETSPISDAATNCAELQAEVDTCRENEGDLTAELESSGSAWSVQHDDKHTWKTFAGTREDWRRDYERRHRVNGLISGEKK